MSSHAKFRKGQFVRYSTGRSVVRARVDRVHRDGSYTVQAFFFVCSDGKDAPGFLGYRYRMPAQDLRVSA